MIVENRLFLDKSLIVARRIPKHATEILLISDASTKHVDTYPTGGLAYNPLSMTNVSNALIRKIKDEDVHGTSYRDEARLGISDPRTIPAKTDTVGLRKGSDTLSVGMLSYVLLHACSDSVRADSSASGTINSQWETVSLAFVRECP